MNWQEKALRTLVSGLIDKHLKSKKTQEELINFGIEFSSKLEEDTFSVSLDLLDEVTDWDILYECIDAYGFGQVSKEDLIETIMEHIKESTES